MFLYLIAVFLVTSIIVIRMIQINQQFDCICYFIDNYNVFAEKMNA